MVQMMRVNCDTAQEYYVQQTIKDKLQGYNYAYPKSTATILLSLSLDLQQLRDQLQASSSVGRSKGAHGVAQWLERWTGDPKVEGSNPVRSTRKH